MQRVYKELYSKSMVEIVIFLQKMVAELEPREVISFEVVNPDIVSETYSGTKVLVEGRSLFYRSYKSWLDLSQQLGCKMLTPQSVDKNFVRIRYEKLNFQRSFHQVSSDREQKYGKASLFSEIYKNEEASFLYYYLQALQNVHIEKRLRILNLGVNSGDEFEVIESFCKDFERLELIGIDYCHSAIESAREKFQERDNVTFYQHDIKELNSLELGRFDLILSIGTLQSSNLEFNKLLMSIVQNQLKKDGAMILGFPNCRWVDGEMLYGARVKNYSFSEMGLLFKDVVFSKKYLQQKQFRVTITGKDYIFLTATSIKK